MIVEHDGREGLVAPVEAGEVDGVDVYQLTVAGLFGVDHAETVVLLEGEEIHGPGVDVRKLDYQQRGGSGGVHVVPERGADGDVGVFPAVLQRLAVEPGAERIAAAEDGLFHLVAGIDQISQPLTAVRAAAVVIRLPGISRPHSPHIEYAVAQGRGEPVGCGRVHSELRHQGGEELAFLQLTAAQGEGIGAEAQGIYGVLLDLGLRSFVPGTAGGKQQQRKQRGYKQVPFHMGSTVHLFISFALSRDEEASLILERSSGGQSGLSDSQACRAS